MNEDSEESAGAADARDGTDAGAAADGTDAGVAADATETDGTVATLASGTRFGQFVSVGVVGFGFDIVTSTALEALGVLPELAAFVGIEVAVVVMFLLNDRVTFAEEGLAGLGPSLRRLARSNLVRAGGIAVQLIVFTALYRGIALPLSVSGIDLWFVASRAGGVGVGMVVNYVAESLLTWRVTADR